MITTETEAREKFCCALNLNATSKGITCSGRYCMAWRWFGWTPDNDRDAWTRTSNSRSSDYDDGHVRVGYCGLAGRPE